MKKRRYTWLWIATILQYLTAALHSIGFFVQLPPANETEAQLVKLMSTYQLDMGGGFHPTMDNLFLSMSVCFTLLCLFGGLINNFLLKRKAEDGLLKGMVVIQAIIFGIGFLVMAVFTFIPPIISTGLIFLTLLIWLFSFRKVAYQRTSFAN